MRKFCLVSIFIFYQMFVPFVWINCGAHDEPYNLLTQTDDVENIEEDDVSDCESNTFLTADCVEAALQEAAGPPQDSNTDEEEV